MRNNIVIAESKDFYVVTFSRFARSRQTIFSGKLCIVGRCPTIDINVQLRVKLCDTIQIQKNVRAKVNQRPIKTTEKKSGNLIKYRKSRVEFKL